MKALVGAFNQEKALVGAFSVIVKTSCETDGSFYSTNGDLFHIWTRIEFLFHFSVPRGDSPTSLLSQGNSFRTFCKQLATLLLSVSLLALHVDSRYFELRVYGR